MKQIVILADEERQPASNGTATLGERRDLLDRLAARNTASDGRDDDVLYGPGFRLELSPEQDPVTQMLMTLTDEDIAWVVIMRLAREFEWKLLDPMNDRELTPR